MPVRCVSHTHRNVQYERDNYRHIHVSIVCRLWRLFYCRALLLRISIANVQFSLRLFGWFVFAVNRTQTNREFDCGLLSHLQLNRGKWHIIIAAILQNRNLIINSQISSFTSLFTNFHSLCRFIFAFATFFWALKFRFMCKMCIQYTQIETRSKWQFNDIAVARIKKCADRSEKRNAKLAHTCIESRENEYVKRCETDSFQVVAYSSIRIPVLFWLVQIQQHTHTHTRKSVHIAKWCKNEIKNKMNRRNDQSNTEWEFHQEASCA